MRPLLVAAVLLLAASCSHRHAPPTQPLERAADRAGRGSTAHVLAFAGWHALLMAGDAPKAQALFDEAVAADAAEPWALLGQMQLARRAAQPERALGAALDLCQRAPAHPLCAVAARVVMDSAALAASTDDAIAARVPALLQRGVAGDAAHLLRWAQALVLHARRQLPAMGQVLAELGVPTTATLQGPFSPWHVLSMAEPTAAEQTGDLSPRVGPFGPLPPRPVRFADGRFSLAGEPKTGDVYLLAYDVEVKRAGTYVLRTVTSMDHAATLDGTPLLTRSTWQWPAPTLTARGVQLSAGPHRLLVRVAREAQVGFLTVSLAAPDGSPSDVEWKAAQGPAPAWQGVGPVEGLAGLFPSAAALHDALLDEAGDALARFVAAQDALSRDPDGAARLAEGLPESVAAPEVRVLRAELALADRAITARASHSRATRDLEAALTKDKGHLRAVLASAQLAADDGRQPDALEALRAARALGPPPAPLLSQLARVELVLGLDAQADLTAQEALAALPGACDALELRYDLARRRDAVAAADALVQAAARCPNALSRLAEHHKLRGDLAAAARAWEAFLAEDESQVPVGQALASVLAADGKDAEAAQVLARLRATWPREPRLLRQLADLAELAGRDAEAMALREEVLALDGADLSLRRSLERRRRGQELLDEDAISTETALEAWAKAPGPENATSACVLDAAAIRAFPDGSQVDRIHVIQKAYDQAGVQDIAEVNLPEGAQVLKLRTLKADGTTLEPEAIDGKESASLPGVQVGDLVEYEYLLAHPSRGPGQPGFTAANFYFQIARQPNNWSTYKVVAPKGTGLQVDAHNMAAAPPRVEGELEVFTHEERRVPPFIPEPLGPPTPNEWLPFVSVGAGQRGNEGVVRAYADAYATSGLVTHDVLAFARKAAGDRVGLEAVRAVYAAVHEKLTGRDEGLTLSAAASVTQDRGSRTFLLKAALRALGFDARLAVVRAFSADPSPYLFPAEHLLPYLCLRVALPEGGAVWLDPLVRFSPFNELPEMAMGEREAYLLPEPGRPLERVQTPPHSRRPAKVVTLELALDEDGVLTGQGEETYQGFEAAALAEALEALSKDQRDQALQQALSRYFGGADLSALAVDSARAVGGVVKVRYEFRAPRFGRRESEARMVLSPLTFPSQLGRRFLTMGVRRTPLFLEATESNRTEARLTLPKGWALAGLAGVLKLTSPWGHLQRTEVQQGVRVDVAEELRVPQARVPTSKYEEFGQFVGEVDLVQGRDLILERQ